MEPDTTLGDSSLIPVPEPLTIKVIPCTETQGPPEAYRNQSNPRGALLVANYSSFDSPDSKPRLGSEADAEHITELFRQIGYENTKTIVDATKQDTGKALLQFRDEKIHAEVDSLVVVFMSHGAEEYMCTTDGEIIYDQEVIEYFNDVNCPALKGKPKYFIFQHCRGKKEHIVIANKVIDSKVIRKSSVPQKRSRRELSDVYVCYSTLPGFVSYRYDVRGSPYIDRICRVFMEEAHRKEIDTLMKRVEKAMPEAQPTEIRRLGFKSDFYFNPCSPRENALSVTCSDAMETEENIYETTSSPRGHVLIINNLGGCQQDVKKLHDIFTRLGYNVLPPRENLTKEEMEEVFCTFSQTPQYDSAVVIFYGKGFEDCIMSNDGKITTFQELVQTFNDVNCPSLSGRPKLFFINTVFTDDIQQDEVEAAHTECATRHSYRRDIVGQAGLSTDGTNDGTTDLDMAHSTMPVPAERDMYLLSVEVDGECKHGSLLTEAMYQVLIRFANSKELMALTKLILRTLDNLQQGNGVEERYHHEVRTYRFQRDYYFNPPKFIPIPDTPTKPRELKIPKVCFPKKINVRQVKQPKNTHSDYRNWSRPHGLALIISFEKYESEDLPNCPWRQNVANMLSELYSGLGYRTEICNNPTIAEAKARLEEFSNRGEHLNLDSLFVTILGLARDWDSFYCADGKPLHLSDVYSYFTEYSCPALKGKPKLFFLHMTELEEQKKPYESQRELKDTFVVRLSTKVSGTGDHPVAGLLAWRKALEEHAHDTHLESLISKAEMYLHDGASSNTVSNEHFAREVYGAPGKLFFNPSKV
ncbi:uncharacterized protein LOC122257485 [Penaeus japonicus]|uniref:uncharacterized protein LOC122257485 n=1 Tax=Penaeus japonicus TaxID=27405 RepID=UPI001C70B934|nr:uncharacterized protein LOC122257485 [Penaeus japonicus]